ncbi:DNA-binding protein [Facilibium subflavum]|uniref:DNA-binding protein n=1 Tax=Facilibium subflavum TaxID=2219058 RepID=UPI000E658D56|nr:DNA-binding protein [Facilibium subflavum]
MARPGLSYEEVVKAIDKIMAQGEKPTINNVRETIGRGSPTTISKFLKQWKSEAQDNNTPLEPKQTELAVDVQMASPSSAATQQTTKNENIKDNNGMPTINDPIIQALLDSSANASHDILNTMSDEWGVILNEQNMEVKIKKLYAALVKEQTRRETAEKVAKEAKNYADIIKEQTSQRIADLRDTLESQIAFLNGQIRQLKRESQADLEHYRSQLEKANLALAALKNK